MASQKQKKAQNHHLFIFYISIMDAVSPEEALAYPKVNIFSGMWYSKVIHGVLSWYKCSIFGGTPSNEIFYSGERPTDKRTYTLTPCCTFSSVFMLEHNVANINLVRIQKTNWGHSYFPLPERDESTIILYLLSDVRSVPYLSTVSTLTLVNLILYQ